MKRVGREIRDKKEIRLKMSDLRAQGGFLEQARKYFDDVLRFESRRVSLRELRTLRRLV